MNWWLKPVAQPSAHAMEAANTRQQQLTKPPGSLGELETLAVQFAGWQGRSDPRIDKVQIRIFAGDHGVVAEGVSAFPQAVTVQMIQNFASGGAAIAVLARHCGADFSVVNLGTATPAPQMSGVVNVHLAPGSDNFCTAPAMSDEVVRAALACGAEHAPDDGDIFIGGEMGIGNTTAAAALTSALLNLPVDTTVGRGTGIDDQGLLLKCNAVQRALDLHLPVADTALEMLRRLGGLEIAALTGAYIACAQRGIPVLVDGYICTAAALLACRFNPGARAWMLFAHQSTEPGHRHLLQALAAKPLLDVGMRLGEGSGAAVVVPLLQSACHLHNEMATFAEAGVSTGASH
ncbi:Nicotinate-nucleotide--dimethylbenzimidazole phosphoribosyltransferase [Halioglobus japonicus]|nr:Nicotinate-nucleotide--dimethylbenzimidazole phosphoribosyltransferase [Halioglobus japonicus]